MSNISNLTRNDKFGAWFDKINAIIDYLNVFSVDKDNIPPLKHDSDTTIYGVGNNANYGHVMLSDAIDKEYNTEDGIASTPYATKRAYNKALEAVGVAENSLTQSTKNSEKITELENELEEISGEIINHASEKETYGVGTKSLYGHLKLSDSINSIFSESSGVAATPYAIKITYDLAQNAFNLATSNKTELTEELTTKAPIKHNSSEDIYGLGNEDEYGHLKITDNISEDDATKAIAISPKAVKDVESSLLLEINNSKSSITALNNSITNLESSVDEKAPKSHAVTNTIYGIGTGSNYGHVKLSDSVNSTSTTSNGVAATPKAVNDVNSKVITLSDAVNNIQETLDGGGGSTTTFLRGDGTWAVPNETAYIAGNGIKISSNTISLATYGITGSYGSEINQTPKFGEEFDVAYISIDSYGRTTAQTKTVTIPNTPMIGATDSADGQSGLVPAPDINSKSFFLRGDGTWASPDETTYSIMTGADETTDGQSGLVPTPNAGDNTKFLRGDGIWESPNIMIGADDEGDGISGLVPIPLFENGDYDKYLRGDGTWDTPLTVGSNITLTVNKDNDGNEINKTINISKTNVENALGYTINKSVPSSAKFTDTTYSAGTGLSLSSNEFSLATVVTAGNAGPTANASPAHGGSFVVPYITYDAYGRVTGRTNRTITLPAASSGVVQGYVSNTSGNMSGSSFSGTITLPSGGTYAIIRAYRESSGSGANTEYDGYIQAYTAAGGSTVTGVAIAIRIA